MASVRFSRDKRGYEYVSLVQTSTKRGKPGKPRVIYWYRTPPGVRIGRKPFDEEVQRILEQQNPGVTFDWNAIINTPVPPPDMTEYWRERRRMEKAAREERRAMEAEQSPAQTGESPAAQARPESSKADRAPEARSAATQAEPASVSSDAPAADAETNAARKRRRRRGGRRRRSPGDPIAQDESQAAGSTAGSEPSESTDGDLDDPSEETAAASEEE